MLPSLAKPKAPDSSPTPISSPMGMPSAALPPVTSIAPTPEQQRVGAIRQKLQNAEDKPSFTEGLWNRTKGSDSVLGKIGHVGAGILRGVELAGTALAPGLASAIPGTSMNKRLNEQVLGHQLSGAEGQATQEAQAEKDRAEAAKANFEAQPKPVTPKFGVTPFQTDTGTPGVLEEQGPNAGQVFPATGFNAKPDKAAGGNAIPLSQQDADERWGLWTKTNPKLAKLIPANPFKPGMLPEQAKEVEGVLNSAIGKEQGQTHITLQERGMEDKEEKERTAAAQTATQGRMNLYAQQHYADSVAKWHKSTEKNSAQYAKDVTLMTDLIHGEQQGQGVLGGVVGSTPIGVLLGGVGGPAGAATGAGIGLLANALSSPATAALDSLKRQGISPQGYQAMQAYFNALPARMAFEITNQGLKASSMRFGALINKIMNTIPPPNTPRGQFSGAFQQYFNPMKVTLESGERNAKLPQGYQFPSYEEFYPSEEQQSGPWSKYKKQ